MLIPCGNSIFCDFLSFIFRGHFCHAILVAIFVGMFATFLRGLLLQVFICILHVLELNIFRLKILTDNFIIQIQLNEDTIGLNLEHNLIIFSIFANPFVYLIL